MAKSSGSAGRSSGIRSPGVHLLGASSYGQRQALSAELHSPGMRGDGIAIDTAISAVRASGELVVVRDGAGRLAGVANFKEQMQFGVSRVLWVEYLAGIQPGYGIQALREVGKQGILRDVVAIRLMSTTSSAPYYRKLGMIEHGDGTFTMRRDAIDRRWGNG